MKLNDRQAITAYLRHRLGQAYATGETWRGLAKRSGLSHVTLQKIHKLQSGLGKVDTVEALARLFGIDPVALYPEARAWVAANPDEAWRLADVAPTDLEPTESHVEYDERYPNRAVAVKMARDARLSEYAIEGVQSMALKGADLPILAWFDLIRLQDREHELGLPPRFPGQPIDPDEPGTVPKPLPPRKPTKR